MENSKNRLSDAEAAKLILLLANRSEKRYKRASKAGKQPEKGFTISPETRRDLEKIVTESKKK